MTIEQFIFSDERAVKIKRHFLFWIFIGSVYFFQSFILISHPVRVALYSMIFFFPQCVVASYVCMYFLLPRLYKKKTYLIFGLQYLLLFFICLAVNYLSGMIFYRATNFHRIYGFKFSWYFSIAFINTMHLMSITGLSLGIRFTKTWYTTHKENLLLFREKTRKEVRLQKSKAYPEVINKSLATLSNNLRNESGDSPELLLAIADVFSYLLYSIDDKEIEIRKEIAVLKKIQYLENSIPDNSFLISSVITGNVNENLMIPSMSLFSILQGGISVLNQQKEYASELQFDVEITSGKLVVSVTFNSLADTENGNINCGEMLKKQIQSANMVDMSIYKFEKATGNFVQIVIDAQHKNMFSENAGSKALIRLQ